METRAAVMLLIIAASISSATLCRYDSPILTSNLVPVPITYPQIIVPQGTIACQGLISQWRLRVEGQGAQSVHFQLLREDAFMQDEYELLDVAIFHNISPVNGEVVVTATRDFPVDEDTVIGIYVSDDSNWRLLMNSSSTLDVFLGSNTSFNNQDDLDEINGQPLVEITFKSSVTNTNASILMAILIVVILLVLLIVVAIIILVLLVKKTRQRVVVLKQPSEENPTYTRLTLMRFGSGRFSFRRLSQRFRSSRQGAASPSNSSKKVTSSLTSPTSTNRSDVATPTSVYTLPPIVSPRIIEERRIKSHSDPEPVQVRDSHLLPLTMTMAECEGEYSRLMRQSYYETDEEEEGFVVPSEVDRSLCEQFVLGDHHYNKLKFFEQCNEFWQPASTASGLYMQLSMKKYREIPVEQVEVASALGTGNFANVSQGMWFLSDTCIPVAIKSLKQGSTETDRVKFLQEAAIMGQFSHPNIVRLFGVVTVQEPAMIILELLPKGDLLTYLKKLNPTPDPREQEPLQRRLLTFARDVALGMEYLSGKNFVHRDLAARNILLTEDLRCQIGDFGMARDLMDEDYYTYKGGKIPVKWTAPEALLYKKYSTDSDVWSYGILLYEIWSLGDKPFAKLSNEDVVLLAITGLCHVPPPGLPKAIYLLMVDCWNLQHAKRPKFNKIVKYLEQTDSVLLNWSEKDLAVSPLVNCLGAPFVEAKGLYSNVQELHRKNSLHHRRKVSMPDKIHRLEVATPLQRQRRGSTPDITSTSLRPCPKSSSFQACNKEEEEQKNACEILCNS